MKDKIKLLCAKYNIDWQFVKFLFVGGINTLFGYGVFAIFIFIGLHYALSALMATILGVLFNFKTTGIIVFKNHNNKLILKFFLVYGAVYFLTVAVLKGLCFIGSTNMYFNYAIWLLPNAMLSFLLMKKFVFI